MSETTRSHPPQGFYWERDNPPPGELAALRRGVGAAAGEVPAMWPLYRRGEPNWAAFQAEHHTLALFAVHYQSRQGPVHRAGTPMAASIRQLRTKFSEAAVDRRFFAAATAPDLGEVVHHLRGLVRQLRALDRPTGFDYTRLFHDLRGWSEPERRSRSVREWGREYYRVDGSASDEDRA